MREISEKVLREFRQFCEAKPLCDFTQRVSPPLRLSSLEFLSIQYEMPCFAPRISLPYSDMSGVVEEWSKHCEEMVVYEHQADESVKCTHLHLLMLNTRVKEEAFKRMFHSRVKTDLKGNDLWKWATKWGIPGRSFITYMTKGKHSYKFCKNIPDSEIEALRLQWKDPTPKGELLTERKESSKTRQDLIQLMRSKYKPDEKRSHLLDNIAEDITEVIIDVLNEHKIIFSRRKIQEYRDTIMGEHHKLLFKQFVNEDIYRYLKYNG